MRVKIFKVAAMAVFVFITIVNVYKAQTSVQLSDAQLKNVEALASGEDENGKTSCFKKTTKAPDDNSLAVWVISCSSCEGLWVTAASEASNCE